MPTDKVSVVVDVCKTMGITTKEDFLAVIQLLAVSGGISLNPPPNDQVNKLVEAVENAMNILAEVCSGSDDFVAAWTCRAKPLLSAALSDLKAALAREEQFDAQIEREIKQIDPDHDKPITPEQEKLFLSSLPSGEELDAYFNGEAEAAPKVCKWKMFGTSGRGALTECGWRICGTEVAWRHCPYCALPIEIVERKE